MLMFKEGFSIVQGRLLLNYVKVKGGFFISVLYYFFIHLWGANKQTNRQAFSIYLYCAAAHKLS